MARTHPFDTHTARYESWFERHRFAYESELAALRALLPAHVERAVEIGVGTGRFAAPLRIRLGLEPSQAMAQIARQRGIEVIEGVAEALPWADNEFDLVLMVTTICFVDDLERSFHEAYRVLKADGVLLIGMVDRQSPLGQEYKRRKFENVFYREANFYSTEEVVDVLRRVGFEDFKFAQTIFRPLEEIQQLEPVKSGYGEGSFVAIRTRKYNVGTKA